MLFFFVKPKKKCHRINKELYIFLILGPFPRVWFEMSYASSAGCSTKGGNKSLTLQTFFVAFAIRHHDEMDAVPKNLNQDTLQDAKSPGICLFFFAGFYFFFEWI
jgi:hypothetical protein